MQIIDIEEPDSSNNSESDEVIVGIDFGTTNSLIAISVNSDVRYFSTESGSDLLPSIIGMNDADDGWVIGRAQDNLGYVRSVKRLFAKSCEEITASEVLNSLIVNADIVKVEDKPQIAFTSDVDKKSHSIPHIAAQIFRSLKDAALKQLNFEQLNFAEGKKLKAVVSVPAYFNDLERGQVMLAAKYADIDVIRLIPEPTAAAYAYGLHKETTGTYLVYDLGGGTFDVSILEMSEGILQVIACGGDNNLGGDDIDFAIAESLAMQYKLKFDSEISISPQLISQAKRLKESLSKEDSVQVNLNEQELIVSRDDINSVIESLIDRTITIAKNVHLDADNIDIDGVILVGGSTRIPLIRRKLQQEFAAKIYDSLDPDRAVVCGAALQAENLATNKGNLLIDVVPLSVGLELYGGLFERVILRNTPLPFSVSKEFTTQVDLQTAMSFHVLQGEREMAADCRSLAHFELNNLSGKKAGMVKVMVTFSMDADGILSVTANEIDSDKVVNIICNPGYKMTEEQIATDLENAYENASIDHEQRLITETVIEVQELVDGLKIALKQTPDVISDIEYNEINDRIAALENAVIDLKEIGKDKNPVSQKSADMRDNIISMMQELNSNAANFIERHLNIGADKMIVGKNINDLEK